MAYVVTPGQVKTISVSQVTTGEGVTAESARLRLYNDTDEALTDVAMVSQGPGTFSADVTFPSAIGHYLLRIFADDANDEPVEEVWTEDVWVRPYRPAGAVTRLSLVERIATTLGDRLDIISTSSGSTTTINSAMVASIEPGYLIGRELICVAGPRDNLHITRRVTQNSRQSATITVDRPFPLPTGSNNRFLTVNKHGRGWEFWEYHAAINKAIGDAQGYHLVPTDIEVTVTDDNQVGVGSIVLPSDWTHLSGIDLELPSGGGGETFRAPRMPEPIFSNSGPNKRIPVARNRGDSGYYLLPGSGIRGRTVELTGQWFGYAVQPGAKLHVSGYRPPDLLQADDDWTTVNPEWIEYQAAAFMLLSGLERDRSREGLATYMQRKADSIRSLIRTPVAPNTVNLPL